MQNSGDEIRHDTVCRLCGSSRVLAVMSLAPTPAEDQFVTSDERSLTQKCYPLDLALCQQCEYVYLPYILNPEISYPNYTYVSKVTVGLSNHYQEYADDLLSRFAIAADALVVDLGSNDGTMLEAFKLRGRAVLGVEPGRAVSKIAQEAGIPTINAFFTSDTVSEIVAGYGRPKLVTANYMFANIDDLRDFTNNVAALLDDEGIFSVQTGYHPEHFKLLMFDYIYHEHFSYFTAARIESLFRQSGLELIFVQKTSAKGGSVRFIAQKLGAKRSVDRSVEEILAEEVREEVSSPKWFADFSQRLLARRNEVRQLLEGLKASGKSIVGYGASHSTTTLIYHFGLADFIDKLVDDNPIKHGRYSPGLHLPVSSSSSLLEGLPDYVFILGWQHQNSIIDRNREYLKRGGKFIVPMPDLKIISA